MVKLTGFFAPIRWLVLVLSLALLAACNGHNGYLPDPPVYKIRNDKPGTGPIVAFGDTLTSGSNGVVPYTKALSDKLGVQIVNVGIKDLTTSQAIVVLNDTVLSLHPKVVLLTLGLDDFAAHPQILGGDTVANLKYIITTLHKNGAMVVYGGTNGALEDVYPGASLWPTRVVEQIGFDRLAKSVKAAAPLGAIVINDVMQNVWTDPKLKFDRLHPNSDGQAKIADQFAQALVGHYP